MTSSLFIHLPMKTQGTSSFPIPMHFFTSFCPTALARTSYVSGECVSSYLFPYLKVKAFSFSQLSILLAMGLSYVAFIILTYFLLNPLS